MNDDERLCLIIFVTWSILMFCPETRQCNYRPQQVCECGRSQQYQYSRIVNGQQVRPHVYPWVALLLSKNKAVCGGSVINNYYVLSAGHCKQQQEKVTDFTVALGVHDRITMDDGQARIYNVIKIIVHPDYEELKFRNDIALFKLHKEIKFDFFVRPICLPYRGEDFTGRSAIVTGWGTKRFGKTYRDRFLQQVTLIVLSEDECAQSEMRSSYTNHSKLMLCAYENGVDACKGDSGGPLFASMKRNLMVQIGIVSFGRGCAQQSMPGIYTKVSYFVNWVYENTQDAKFCLNPRESKDVRVLSKKGRAQLQSYRNCRTARRLEAKF